MENVCFKVLPLSLSICLALVILLSLLLSPYFLLDLCAHSTSYSHVLLLSLSNHYSQDKPNHNENKHSLQLFNPLFQGIRRKGAQGSNGDTENEIVFFGKIEKATWLAFSSWQQNRHHSYVCPVNLNMTLMLQLLKVWISNLKVKSQHFVSLQTLQTLFPQSLISIFEDWIVIEIKFISYIN